jgi:ABC-type glycerol-3-phosphate transport system substrate-binding protein
MRKMMIVLIVASLMLAGTVGCGGSDPANKAGFKKENINPSMVKIGETPMKSPGGEKPK